MCYNICVVSNFLGIDRLPEGPTILVSNQIAYNLIALFLETSLIGHGTCHVATLCPAGFNHARDLSECVFGLATWYNYFVLIREV